MAQEIKIHPVHLESDDGGTFALAQTKILLCRNSDGITVEVWASTRMDSRIISREFFDWHSVMNAPGRGTT